MILVLGSVLLPHASNSQSTVTFSVSVDELEDKNCFEPDDIIIVRGSFNNWSGIEYKLEHKGETGIYAKSFEISANVGDMIEYKYVIIGSDGREFWESAPNPENKPYGNRKLEITSDEIILPEAQFIGGNDILGRAMSWDEKFRADFMEARQILEENHPALYDYSTKKAIDKEFDHYYEQINSETNFAEFYQYLSRVMALIGCGHTKLFIPKNYWDENPDHFFPLQIIINNKEVLISGSYDSSDFIQAGSKLIAVDGMDIQKIIMEMLPLESADGFIQSFKVHSIQDRFPEKYALMYGFPDSYKVSYISPGKTEIEEMVLAPASFEQFTAVWKSPNILSFDVVEGKSAGLMVINTFGYYSEVPMFRAFIDSSFRVMKEQNIQNLIIDLRGNDGGDPYCASYLFSYLEEEAVPYFIEAYPHYDTLSKPMVMAENNYKGNVYVIIDGGGFSTTGHLCGLLAYHKLVTFVGTDLGSTYTCTGNTMYPQLTYTQLFLGTAKERRYTAAVSGMKPTEAIHAEVFVETSAEYLAKGKDTQLEYIFDQLIE